jgi:hypothetical protein
MYTRTSTNLLISNHIKKFGETMPTHDAIEKKHAKERKNIEDKAQKDTEKILKTKEAVNNLKTSDIKTLNKKKHK